MWYKMSFSIYPGQPLSFTTRLLISLDEGKITSEKAFELFLEDGAREWKTTSQKYSDALSPGMKTYLRNFFNSRAKRKP